MWHLSTQQIVQFVLNAFKKMRAVHDIFMLVHTASHNGLPISNVFDATPFVFGATKKKHGVKGVVISSYRFVLHEKDCCAINSGQVVIGSSGVPSLIQKLLLLLFMVDISA